MTFRSATKLLLRPFLGCSSWSPNSFRSLTFSRNQCCQKGVLPGSYGGLTTSSYVVFGLVLMVLVVFPLKLAHIFARCTTHYYSEAESHAQQWPPAPAGSPSRRPNDDIKRSITSTAILGNLHANTLVQNSSNWPVLIQLMEECWELHPAQKVPSPASGPIKSS